MAKPDPALPRIARLMKPCPATQVPAGPGWRHEIKHDGHRCLALLSRDGVRLKSRNGHDFTKRHPAVAKALAPLAKRSVILDGEIAIPDAAGVTRLSQMHTLSAPAIFYVFDLLAMDGEPLFDLPIEKRKALLKRLLARSRPPVVFSDWTENGARLLAAVCAAGAEGIVSKRLGSRYRGGPSRDWLKIKCAHYADQHEAMTRGWNTRR